MPLSARRRRRTVAPSAVPWSSHTAGTGGATGARTAATTGATGVTTGVTAARTAATASSTHLEGGSAGRKAATPARSRSSAAAAVTIPLWIAATSHPSFADPRPLPDRGWRCGTHEGHLCQESVRTWPGDSVLPLGLA